MPTPPSPINALTPVPDPDDRTNFDELAYNWTESQQTFGEQLAAAATNVYGNAVEAVEAAETATTKAVEASQSATAAEEAAGSIAGAVGAAIDAAGTATTKAGEAADSAAAAEAAAAAAQFAEVLAAPTLGAGSARKPLRVNAAENGWELGEIERAYITASADVASYENLVDTSAGPLTLTLPAAPATGHAYRFVDLARTFLTKPLTLARNGQTIEGVAQDLDCNIDGLTLTLWFNGTTWRIA